MYHLWWLFFDTWPSILCSKLFRTISLRGAAGNVVIVKHASLTSAIRVAGGGTKYLCWLFAYISWWCKSWVLVNIACRLLSDLVCRTCWCIMSKLSCSTFTNVTVVTTSTMAVMIIGILDAVRAKNVVAGIIKTTSTIDHRLIRLHANVLERAHYRRVRLLELL